MRMKINDLSLWEAYVAVAQQGNFAKAALALKTPVPQISKRVAKLESLLEVRLFTRSTRVVKLTNEGRGLLERAVSLLEDSEGLETSFAEKHLISGSLRITSAPFIAHRLLAPVLREYLALYPRVDVQVDLSETVHQKILDAAATHYSGGELEDDVTLAVLSVSKAWQVQQMKKAS